jgi:meso-butanediol dehydrogenase / (S,S)-butanediol dehydrogenase / diacetyl reductase
MKRFEGKVVIVTGAASGIGAATSRRFADEGAHLVVSDIREDVLRPVAEELERSGSRILCQRTDVGDCDDVQRLIETAVAHFGRLDVLINNAGITSFGHVTELTPEHWRKVMAVDLDSIFFAARAAIPHLAKTGGCIVNTASISGLFGDYGLAAYNTAKGGVVNLTRNLAIDHAPDGIRVNSVCPGPVATRLTAAMAREPDFMDEYRKLVPMARMAQPEEIAAAIAFLASADASYITGHNLVVDGGVTAATGQPNFSRMFRERGWDDRRPKG